MTDVVIRLTGEFDISNAQTILDTVAQATVPHGGAELIVDLSGVTFLDAAGIRALLRAQQQAQHRGGRLVVREPSPLVTDVLSVLGLTDQLFGSTTVPESKVVARGRQTEPGPTGSSTR